MLTNSVVLKEEQELTFATFVNTDALGLATIVENRVAEQQLKPIALAVFLDGKMILTYMTQGRKDLGWVERKVHTVLSAKHCSLYTFLHREEIPYSSWLQDDQYAVGGGGFPLVINNQLRGAFAVSGLQHEEDHALLVSALKELKQKG